MNTFLYVVRSPTSHILEEAYASNVLIIAQIEPVFHATRDIDHITTFDSYTEYRSSHRIQMKNPFAGNSKPHLIFTVSMFLVELLEHCIQVGRVRSNIDDICRDKTTFLLDQFDFRGIFCQDILVGCSRAKSPRNLPLFEPNAERLQKLGNLCWVVNSSLLRWNKYSGQDFFESTKVRK